MPALLRPLSLLITALAGSGAAEQQAAALQASRRFDCPRTDGLRTLGLGALLDSFPRRQHVDAQLRRPARSLAWGQ